MNKKLAILLSSVLMVGIASAQEQSAPAAAVSTPAEASATATMPAAPAAVSATANAAKAACASEAACTKQQVKSCCHNVLTPQERHRFCEVKAKVIAANPGLKEKGQKHALCDAIVKEDPSMAPILEKLRKHCEQTHSKMGHMMRSMNNADAAPATTTTTK